MSLHVLYSLQSEIGFGYCLQGLSTNKYEYLWTDMNHVCLITQWQGTVIIYSTVGCYAVHLLERLYMNVYALMHRLFFNELLASSSTSSNSFHTLNACLGKKQQQLKNKTERTPPHVFLLRLLFVPMAKIHHNVLLKVCQRRNWIHN